MRTIGVRNENYWRPGRPYLDEIELIGIPDEAARVNALHLGRRADDRRHQSALDPPDRGGTRLQGVRDQGRLLHRPRHAPGRRSDEKPGLRDGDQAPVQPRGGADRRCSATIAVVGNDQPIDPSNRYYCKDVPQRPFDPDKAKFHFQKTGIGNTAVPLFASTAAPGSIEMAVLLQEAAQKIGLNIDIKRVPADGYWANILDEAAVRLRRHQSAPERRHPAHAVLQADADWNESGWKNEKFDQLLAAARAESDEAKRRQHYCDMQMSSATIAASAFRCSSLCSTPIRQGAGPEADPARRPHGQRLRRARLARGVTDEAGTRAQCAALSTQCSDGAAPHAAGVISRGPGQ